MTTETINITNISAKSFHQRLLSWYHQSGRKNLPWQQNKTSYRVWISEIMLQQTQVATVIPYYARFMESFPSIEHLANANEDKVLHHWTGLGYYARARNLHKAAKMICSDFNGNFPTNIDDVISLPGIGRSTAAAILSISQKQHHAILDDNVKRVLSRFYTVSGHNGQAKYEKTLWPIAEKLTPKEDVASYTQAIMDLGATICTRSKPKCEQCPVASSCLAKAGELQSQFPNKKPKKKIPEKNTMMVIPRIEQQVLMEKRPPTGIWGGLWCFYEIPQQGDLTQLLEKLSLTALSTTQLTSFRHTFSHFHLDITPLIVDCDPSEVKEIQHNTNQQWYNLTNKQDVGLAASTVQLINLLTEN